MTETETLPTGNQPCPPIPLSKQSINHSLVAGRPAMLGQLVLPAESLVALVLAVFEGAGKPRCGRVVLGAIMTAEVSATGEGLVADGTSRTSAG